MAETPGGDDISAEARMMAAQVRQAATDAPDPEELARIISAALRRQREGLTPADTRHLAVTAFTMSQQVSFLLGKLAGLLGDEEEASRGA